MSLSIRKRIKESADPVGAGEALNAENKAPGEAKGTIYNTTINHQAQLPPPPLKVIPENITEALKAFHQWVLWRYVSVGKKWTKVPYQINGRNASVTNPQHYSEFTEVMAAYEEGGFSGIGFVLTANDPFVGIDIDHCLNGEEITEEAKGIIHTLNSYTEVSPSGEGIRIFVKGEIPKALKRPQLEMYDRGRYVTVTGQRWQP